MHQSILAKRRATAVQRIVTKASTLAAFLNLDPSLAGALEPKGVKDAQVVDMLRLEALADLMDRIAENAGVSEPVTVVTEPESKPMEERIPEWEDVLSEKPAEAEEPAAVEPPEEVTEEPAPKKSSRPKRKTTKK